MRTGSRIGGSSSVYASASRLVVIDRLTGLHIPYDISEDRFPVAYWDGGGRHGMGPDLNRFDGGVSLRKGQPGQHFLLTETLCRLPLSL